MIRLLLFLCCLIVLFCTPTKLGATAASERGGDLSLDTISSMLGKMKSDIPENVARLEARQKTYLDRIEILQDRLHELQIAVYFQDFNNLFFITYYCRQIADLKDEFFGGHFPFATTRQALEMERDRFSLLGKSLAVMQREEQGDLTTEEQIVLADAIVNCQLLWETYDRFYRELLQEQERYDRMGEAIMKLDIYANGRDIEEAIFYGLTNPGEDNTEREDGEPAGLDTNLNGGKLTQRIAMALWNPSHPFNGNGMSDQPLSVTLPMFAHSFYDTYIDPADKMLVSELKDFFIYFFLSFAVFLSATMMVAKRIVARKNMGLRQNGRILIESLGIACVLEALFLYGYSFFIKQGFLRYDVVEGAQFLVIVALIMFSLVVRLPARRAYRGLWLFVPSILLSALIVLYSLAMAPTLIIDTTLPFAFGISAVSTGWLLLARSRGVPVALKVGTAISLLVSLVGVVVSIKGYCYMMMIVQLVWFMLLAGILVMTTVAFVVDHWKMRRKSPTGYRAWVQLLVSQFGIPFLALLCLWYGLIWPADIFDLTHVFMTWVEKTHQVNGFIKALSVERVMWIVTMGIALNCFISIARQTLQTVYGSKFESGRIPTLFTFGTMFAWGIFLVCALRIVKADYHGILVVMGGMSVGIGFALKDTIENLICGLSLMLGRLRPGDIVECDGIRGKVSSIGYRTTSIETVNGSIIAFQNSQLFNRNFSNLTKNHHYERATVHIGVTYGTNIAFARKLILNELAAQPKVSKQYPPSVALDNFGESSINLVVSVWVPVEQKSTSLSSVREAIYRAFNENGIKIPFPQQDLYIKTSDSPEGHPFVAHGETR